MGSLCGSRMGIPVVCAEETFGRNYHRNARYYRFIFRVGASVPLHQDFSHVRVAYSIPQQLYPGSSVEAHALGQTSIRDVLWPALQSFGLRYFDVAHRVVIPTVQHWRVVSVHITGDYTAYSLAFTVVSPVDEGVDISRVHQRYVWYVTNVSVQISRSAGTISPMLSIHWIERPIHFFHALQVSSQVLGRYHIFNDALDIRIVPSQPVVYGMRIDESLRSRIAKP